LSKTVLITGCSSGIGLCLAEGLHTRGYRVFASARKPEDVQSLVSKGLEAVQLDLDSSESINHACDEVFRLAGGRVDALINNGAYGQPGAVADLSRDALRQQFETNLFGTQELTNRILPLMRAQGHGRIIQVSSLLGYVSFAYRGAYNASKYALEALSETMRLELRDTNIHVCLVEPGPVVSRFRDNAYQAYLKNIDRQNSAYRELYAGLEQRLEGKKGKMPFTLPPEAVLDKVVHALEASKPRIRYPVTLPAHFFLIMRRLLPYRWLEHLLYLSGDRNR